MASPPVTFSISDLAKEFALTTRAIRFYEDERLIAPTRSGRTRVYGPRERTRLKLILRGKRLGLSLGEIREILDLHDTNVDQVPQLRKFLQWHNPSTPPEPGYRRCLRQSIRNTKNASAAVLPAKVRCACSARS